MDTIIKAKWLKALRSGDYQQGIRRLCKDDKYCCLGVLGDLLVKEQPDRFYWGQKDDDVLGYGNYLFDKQGDHEDLNLPPSVQDFVGINQSDTKVLTAMNDGSDHHKRASFIEIADYIQDNL